MFLVERLRYRQRGLGGKPEAPVGIALQAGEVVEQWRELRRELAFFLDDSVLAFAFGANRVGARAVPQALGPQVAVVGFLAPAEFFIEPVPGVGAGFAVKGGADLEIIARHELLDLLFSLDQDRERRGLHAPDRGEMESAGL
mgnify:CR=1 FL=1